MVKKNLLFILIVRHFLDVLSLLVSETGSLSSGAKENGPGSFRLRQMGPGKGHRQSSGH